MPNATRNLIFRDNIYLFSNFIKIRGARMNCIKDHEFESRHCQLEFEVSISISHLICINLLRCKKIVRLARVMSCSCSALLRRLIQGSWELFQALWAKSIHWFHITLLPFKAEWWIYKWILRKLKGNRIIYHYTLFLCLSLSINLSQETLCIILIFTDRTICWLSEVKLLPFYNIVSAHKFLCLKIFSMVWI